MAGNTSASATYSSPINIDTTAPVITSTSYLNGSGQTVTPNANNWFNVPLTVKVTATDNLSGFSATDATNGVAGSPAGQTTTTLSDGANQSASLGLSDLAGNSASSSVSGINVDTVAPVVTGTSVINTSTGATVAANGNGWYNVPLSVVFDATDATSGFSATDATSHTAGGLTGQRTIALAGDHQNQSVTQSFTDLAGNTSAPSTVSSLNVDTTAPVITATPYLNGSGQTVTPNANNWFNVPLTVKVTATDNLSGFSATDATNGVAGDLNGQKTTTLSDGANQSASLGLSDLAGNSASSSVSGINVDTAAPVVTGTSVVNTSTGAAVAANGNGWYNVPLSVVFDATDATSGFSATDATSHTAGGLTAQRTIALPGDGPGQSVTQSFADLAGNTSASSTVANLSVDTVAPTLNVNVQPTQASPYTDPAGHAWYPATVNVTFTATDATSGFANGSLTALTTVPVSDGANQVITQSFSDLAGNAVSGSSPALYVDTLPPTITSTLTRNGTTATLSFAVTDAGSGIASCTVSVDGVVVQQTCDPYQVTTADAGKVVTATATDNVGHQATSQNTVSFAPPEAYNQFDPVTQTVQVFTWDPTTGTSTGPIAPVSETEPQSAGTFCKDPHSGKWFGPFPTAWWNDPARQGHGQRLPDRRRRRQRAHARGAREERRQSRASRGPELPVHRRRSRRADHLPA